MPTPLSKKISILKDQALAGKVHAAEEFESFVPHMYLDVVGQVTVGIGHGVLDAKAASLIAFKKADGSSASEGEITKEFNALIALASSQRDKPKSAKHFEALTVLRIDEATAYNVAARDIGAKEKDIKRHFPDYDSYPGGVQEAILDMVFSMGIGKLLRSYPSFCKAVRERNWKAAAEHSNRRQVQVRRNTTVKDKLANAGKSVGQGDMAMAGRR